jgi:hypothetical protein
MLATLSDEEKDLMTRSAEEKKVMETDTVAASVKNYDVGGYLIKSLLIVLLLNLCKNRAFVSLVFVGRLLCFLGSILLQKIRCDRHVG